nr:hypothetical protein [Tanacetum cinerariifolium]
MYDEQHEIIKHTIGNDQINSDIIFDYPNVEFNDGKAEHDKNAHDREDNAIELLASSAYKEAKKQLLLAKKVNKKNVEHINELERYKEKVWVFENTNENKTNFQNKYIEADKQEKKLEVQFQAQFIQERDNIRALEKEKANLQTSVSNERKKSLQLNNKCTSLKHKFNEQEDQHLDAILNLEAIVKKDEDVVVKIRVTVYVEASEKYLCSRDSSTYGTKIFKADMLGMVVDMQEGHLVLNGSLLKVEMFRQRLGMEMYREYYELIHQETIKMFSATTSMLKAIMHESV